MVSINLWVIFWSYILKESHYIKSLDPHQCQKVVVGMSLPRSTNLQYNEE